MAGKCRTPSWSRRASRPHRSRPGWSRHRGCERSVCERSARRCRGQQLETVPEDDQMSGRRSSKASENRHETYPHGLRRRAVGVGREQHLHPAVDRKAVLLDALGRSDRTPDRGACLRRSLAVPTPCPPDRPHEPAEQSVVGARRGDDADAPSAHFRSSHVIDTPGFDVDWRLSDPSPSPDRLAGCRAPGRLMATFSVVIRSPFMMSRSPRHSFGQQPDSCSRTVPGP